jgi:hypothetical protein
VESATVERGEGASTIYARGQIGERKTRITKVKLKKTKRIIILFRGQQLAGAVHLLKSMDGMGIIFLKI